MTLIVGDHLVIKRNGEIVESEAYHEFEVRKVEIDVGKSIDKTHYSVELVVIK